MIGLFTLVKEAIPFLFSFKQVKGGLAIALAGLACFALFWVSSNVKIDSIRRETQQQVEQAVAEKNQVRTRIRTDAAVDAKTPEGLAEELMRWAR